MTTDPNDWTSQALCRFVGHPTDWDDTLDFSRDEVTESEPDRIKRHGRAKGVCARCPVRLRCAEECDLERDSGVWFGLHLEAWRKAQRSEVRRADKNYQLLGADQWTA